MDKPQQGSNPKPSTKGLLKAMFISAGVIVAYAAVAAFGEYVNSPDGNRARIVNRHRNK